MQKKICRYLGCKELYMVSSVYQEDMEYISSTKCIDWNFLKDKKIFITGGTGLIGSTVIDGLLYSNEKYDLHLQIIALVRNLKKAKARFPNNTSNGILKFVLGSVEELPDIQGKVDYIIHGASPTGSLYFIKHPVETIQTVVKGTKNILELAKKHKVESILYLSSMEIYGAPLTDDFIPETQGCTLNSMTVRSCYPIAKRLCENLCAGYSSEYGVPAKVIRLAQTFGPGVNIDDKRVFAEFARDAIQGKNIELQTSGSSKRMYLYTADAVTAILTILLSGETGEAYNAANPETYCSIVEMAQLVAHKIGKNDIKVCFPSANKESTSKYPPSHHLRLDTSKLRDLGWTPSIGLKDMYLRMIATM